MRKFNLKHGFAFVIILTLVITLLSGCGGGKDGTAAGNGVMGRYIEETLDLVTGSQKVLEAFREGGALVYYARDDVYSGRVSRNVYKDGALQTEYPALLNEFAEETGLIWNISESPDGSLMALYYDDDYNFSLARIADGAITRLSIPGWTYNLYTNGTTFPARVIALDDSFLVLFYRSHIVQYDYNGVILREYPVKTGRTGLAVYDGTLAALDIYDNELVLLDLSTGGQTTTVSVSELLPTGGISAEGDVFLAYDDTGFYITCADGVFTYDGQGFVIALDGGLTSLVMPSVEIDGVVRIGDMFYAFLSNMSKTELVRYTYRGDMPQTPSVTLEIFSLDDSLTLRQAIGEFQRKNPDVRVDMRIGLDGSYGATAEDVVRALNTEILAGKGPDLLILDGLPITSYIEKGVLKDISALCGELVSGGGLIGNMKNTYAGADGGIYGLPARFTVPVMLGDAETLKTINSLTDLTVLVAERQSEDRMFLFPPHNLYIDFRKQINPSSMLMNYYDVCAKRFIDPDGSVNEEGLGAYFRDMLLLEETLKAYTPATAYEIMFTRSLWMTASGIGAEYVDMSAEHMAEGKAQISIMTLCGPQSLRFITQTLYYIDAVMAPVWNGDSYFPVCGIGVVSTSKKQELAESFIRILLSDTVQNQTLGDGFPVNRRSLEYAIYDRVQYWMEYVGADELLDMGFIKLAESLTEPVFTDSVVKSAVESQISALAEGLINSAEAASRVAAATRLYLAE